MGDDVMFWAVHLSAGVVGWPWLIVGFALTALLMWAGSLQIADEEIPRTAVFASLFFVAGLIHVRLGPTSVHLLLNGLVGLILGRRALIAIPLGVGMQAVLLGHGDLSTVGLNSLVMALPALAAPLIYRLAHDLPSFGMKEATIAVSFFLFPWSIVAAVPIVLSLRWLGLGAKIGRDFRAGFAVGFACVLMTVLLNSLVLVLGGEADWTVIAVVSAAAHLPVAVAEGVIVGFLIQFLIRVTPQILPIAVRSIDVAPIVSAHSNGKLS